MTMTSKQEVFPVLCILLALFYVSHSQNQMISEQTKKIFLSKRFNSTETVWILQSARESFLLLKSIEKQLNASETFNFVNNYAYFLLKLFKELEREDVDIFQIFSKENSFLKDCNISQTIENFNVTELKSAIEEVQFEIEKHLISYYNTSIECYDVLEVLTLNETSFALFLKEKMRADYSEIGYFFLEVFATLIGLSWGIISTVLHITHPMSEQ